jgi:uncharacterized cupredoxin-like copper-binding protein
VRRLVLAAAAALLAVLGTACGSGSGSDGGSAAGSAPDRVVEVAMVDTAFEPDRVEVAAGEVVRFVFTNEGEVRHEADLGDPEEAEGGHDHGGGGGGDGDERRVVLEPGERGELTRRFEEAGTVEIGCHEPGHHEAGMRLAVEVTEP